MELILVMALIAIVAAVAVPTMRAFTIGRGNANTATQIISVANYARAQATAEGRTYRLNFDPQGGAYWLTAQTAAMFQPPGSDFGQRFQVADGVQMDVRINPQASTGQLPQLDQQESVTESFGPISQAFTQPNSLVQHLHGEGLYVEFQPSGRTDPVQIRLTDQLGGEINIECPSATETFRILTAAEMAR